MSEEKYPNSPRSLDLTAICLDARFGDLKFQKALPQLASMRADLVELENLDYKASLTQQEVSNIDSVRSNFTRFIQLIQQFTLSEGAPGAVRDRIENEISSFYNNNFAPQFVQTF